MVVIEKAEALRDVEVAAPRAERLRHRDHVPLGVSDSERGGAAADSRGWRRVALGAAVSRRLRTIDLLEQIRRMGAVQVRSEVDVEQGRIGNAS